MDDRFKEESFILDLIELGEQEEDLQIPLRKVLKRIHERRQNPNED